MLDTSLVCRVRRWELDASACHDEELVPSIVESVCRDFELDIQRPRLYMIFSELLSNAIDHGLLRLNSVVKDRAEGFEQYLAERQRRLAQLQCGSISVVVQSQRLEGHQFVLSIDVTDTGPGFDFLSRSHYCATELHAAHGRGLAILRHLCESLEHSGGGNRVTVTFDCSA